MDNGPADYNLYAVVVHEGLELSGGHYVAMVRAEDGQWWLCNDKDVSKISTKKVLGQSAYMLFYKRNVFRPAPTLAGQTPAAAAAAAPLLAAVPGA